MARIAGLFHLKEPSMIITDLSGKVYFTRQGRMELPEDLYTFSVQDQRSSAWRSKQRANGRAVPRN